MNSVDISKLCSNKDYLCFEDDKKIEYHDLVNIVSNNNVDNCDIVIDTDHKIYKLVTRTTNSNFVIYGDAMNYTSTCKHCTNCIDCDNCVHCNQCKWCNKCEYCNKCTNCAYVSYTVGSSECYLCKCMSNSVCCSVCEYSHRLDVCYGTDYSDDCDLCANVRHCSVCELCNNAIYCENIPAKFNDNNPDDPGVRDICRRYEQCSIECKIMDIHDRDALFDQWRQKLSAINAIDAISVLKCKILEILCHDGKTRYTPEMYEKIHCILRIIFSDVTLGFKSKTVVYSILNKSDLDYTTAFHSNIEDLIQIIAVFSLYSSINYEPRFVQGTQ